MAGGRLTDEGTGFIMDTHETSREGETRDQQVIVPDGTGSGTVSGARVSVGNTPTIVAQARSFPRTVIIQNHGDKEVDLGGATVSSGAGFRLLGADGAMTPPINTRAAIYGIVAAGTQNVSVLEIY